MGVKLLIREYENPNRDDNHPLRSHLNLLETHFAVIIGFYCIIIFPQIIDKFYYVGNLGIFG